MVGYTRPEESMDKTKKNNKDTEAKFYNLH